MFLHMFIIKSTARNEVVGRGYFISSTQGNPGDPTSIELASPNCIPLRERLKDLCPASGLLELRALRRQVHIFARDPALEVLLPKPSGQLGASEGQVAAFGRGV